MHIEAFDVSVHDLERVQLVLAHRHATHEIQRRITTVNHPRIWGGGSRPNQLKFGNTGRGIEPVRRTLILENVALFGFPGQDELGNVSDDAVFGP